MTKTENPSQPRARFRRAGENHRRGRGSTVSPEPLL